MGKCSGNCGGCSGCAGALELTEQELALLEELAQIPFLPVVRAPGEDTPRCPGDESEEGSLVLQFLEKKGLISLDYDQPIRGFDYGEYRIRGSIGLTARGQRVLELLEIQGLEA